MSKRARMADGTVLVFPDDTPDDVMDRVAKQHATQSRPSPPAWTGLGQDQPKPNTWRDYPGMANRAVMKGLGSLGSITDALTGAGIARAITGAPTGGDVAAASAKWIADKARFASPQTDNERLASAGIEGAAATAPMLMMGGGFATKPLQQLASGAGAMSSGEFARQKGAGPMGQFGASLLGGLAAFGGTNALSNALTRAPRLPVTPPVTAPPSNPLAPLGRKAVVRDAVMRRAGVQNPTTGMVTRDPRIWNFEQQTAKLNGAGDEMQGALVGAQDNLRTEARAIVDRNGGAIGPEMTGIRTGEVLKSRTDALQRDIGNLYKQAGEQFGDARITKLDNLVATQSHPEWQGGKEFDDMAGAISKRLANFADQDGGATGLTVNQAKTLRTFIGNSAPDNPQGWAIKKMFQDALDTDVLDGFGGDPYAKARAAASARFGEFKGTMAGEIADAGGRGAERLPTRLMSAATPLSDVRAVMKSLNSGTTAEQGAQAQSALGSQILDDLLRKHVPEEGTIKGGQLFAEFQKNAPRLQIILGPQRYKELRHLAMAARYATADVPMSGVNYSNTASTVANMLGPQATQSAAGNLLPNLARRVAGTAVGSLGGIPGAIAGDAAASTANQFLAKRASTAANAAIAEQVALSRDPAFAASKIAEVADDVAADPVVRRFAQSLSGSISGAKPVAAIGAANDVGGLMLESVGQSAAARERKKQQQRQQ